MINVRYTKKWYTQGHIFPCVSSFNSWAEYRSWRSDMEDLFGKNFRVFDEWENKPIREESSRIESGRWLGGSGKVDGSTDACILGLDY